MRQLFLHLSPGECSVNVALMLHEERKDHPVERMYEKESPQFHSDKETLLGIDDVGAIGFDWSHAPDQEKAFGEPVERHLGEKRLGNQSLLLSRQSHPAGDEISKVLDDGEEGKDDPVGEPLRVVALRSTLEGLDGAVGWVEESHSVGQQLNEKMFQKVTRTRKTKTNLSSKSKSEPQDNDASKSVGDVQSLHPGVILQHFERVSNLTKVLVENTDTTSEYGVFLKDHRMHRTVKSIIPSAQEEMVTRNGSFCNIKRTSNFYREFDQNIV